MENLPGSATLDVAEAIKKTENALRDLIFDFLRAKYGAEWESKLGIQEDRLDRWRSRKQTEAKRNRGGPVEPRLMYYADFYDLSTIISKNWDVGFKDVFDKKSELLLWLDEMERLRDPNAHNRDLLPYQRHMALGISGYIRTTISRYRSSMVDGDSFFAKIDSARDDVGHFYPPWRSATLTVRVGQEIQIMVSATDPYEAELDYSFQFASGPITWQKSPSFNLVFRESHIARQQALIIRVRSPRNTGPVYESDHMINWHYCVLP